MKNAFSLSFLVLFLGACSHYTYTNTHPSTGLIGRDHYSSEQWREYVQRGGAFRELE